LSLGGMYLITLAVWIWLVRAGRGHEAGVLADVMKAYPLAIATLTSERSPRSRPDK